MYEFKKIGYLITASHCTFSRSLSVLAALAGRGYEIVPIMSENAYSRDTRFFTAKEMRERVEEITGRSVIHTVTDAEPLGPREPLDLLVVAPCTGNTLAKVARGITDTAATMAIKAHLRADRPLLIALASNDALSANLASLAIVMQRPSVYFVPMKQDDPEGKPYSLVAELEMIPECIDALADGRQIRPLFLM